MQYAKKKFERETSKYQYSLLVTYFTTQNRAGEKAKQCCFFKESVVNLNHVLDAKVDGGKMAIIASD